jgi:hypothetical protein
MAESQYPEADAVLEQLARQEYLAKSLRETEFKEKATLVTSGFISLVLIFICALAFEKNKLRLGRNLGIPLNVLQASLIVIWSLFSLLSLLTIGYLLVMLSLGAAQMFWGIS